MRPEPKPIQSLLLRVFLPAVLLVATALAVFAYNWHHSTIIGSFDRKLVTTATLTGAMVDPEDHDALIAEALAGEDPDRLEAGTQYRRNTDPIARIRQRLDLTYLYTQAFGGEQDIVYVLDGTTGEEHSPIGSPDDLTKQTRDGLIEAEEQASVYVSPVEYQEQWGLLKTAAAPVYDASGEVSSTAGADVNISVILVATQNALFASTLIGIGSILACLLVALVIVRRVARPIEALKDRALTIAAGQGQADDDATAPREVAALSAALGSMAQEIARAADLRESEGRARDREADIALLSQDGAGPVQLHETSRGAVYWLPDEGAVAALAPLAAREFAMRLAREPGLAEHWRLLATGLGGACVVWGEGTITLAAGEGVVLVREEQEEPLGPEAAARFDPRADRLRVNGGPVLALSAESTP